MWVRCRWSRRRLGSAKNCHFLPRFRCSWHGSRNPASSALHRPERRQTLPTSTPNTIPGNQKDKFHDEQISEWLEAFASVQFGPTERADRLSTSPQGSGTHQFALSSENVQNRGSQIANISFFPPYLERFRRLRKPKRKRPGSSWRTGPSTTNPQGAQPI